MYFQLEGSSLGNTPSCYSRSRKEEVSDFSVGWVVWPAQKCNLNPTQDLWDELKHRLRARSYHKTSATNHNCSCGWMRAYSCSKFFSWAFLGEWRQLLPEVLNVGIQQSHMGVIFRCPHTFGKQDLQLFIMLTSLIFFTFQLPNKWISRHGTLISSSEVLHISCSTTNNRCVISHWQSIELPILYSFTINICRSGYICRNLLGCFLSITG